MKTFPLSTKHNDFKTDVLDARSIELRNTIVRMLEASRRGHLVSALSLVEILRVLFDHVLRYDSMNPEWPDRDRFILSKGHGCLALYAILAEKGFFPKSELWKFCKREGILGGHPEVKVPGIEASTGSLGHGLSIGIGFALNSRFLKADYRTFVVIGDGESNEGSIWEAAMCASKHRLSSLTVIVDYNKHQSYAPTFEVQDMEPFLEKWTSFGFSAAEADGHNIDSLQSALCNLPFEHNKPSVLICHTVKGKGIECLENDLSWHHKSSITDDDIRFLFTGLDSQ